VLLALLAVLQGCASFQGAPDWDAAKDLATADPLYADAVQKYYAANADRVAVRNQFIEVRAGLVDRRYHGFKDSLYSQRVGAAVGTDIATLALNSVGAAVSSVNAKTAANALSAGIIGSKASIDKNVYFDRTLPALLAQMDGARAQWRARLLAGMLLTPAQYSLMQAASDLDAYFHAGTVPGAVAAITTQAGVSQVEAEKTLRDRLPSEAEIQTLLRGQGFAVVQKASTASAAALAACVQPGGVLPAALRSALEAWLKTNPIDPAKLQQTQTPPFMVLANLMQHPDFEAERAKALTDSGVKQAVEAHCRPAAKP
jgi:hypothetical protein